MKTISALSRPKVAVIYTRVSSQEQVSGYSLADQERICREYARKSELTVIKLFREEGESAKIEDRTQMNLMREYCLHNTGKVGYIIVYKADRFSRDSMGHALLRKFFRDCGVELKSATEPIEDTPYGRFFELMLSGIANLDNDIRTERTVGGMRSKALDGYWPSGAPWGYRNITDVLGRRTIEPDSVKAPIVKFLFQEFSRGTTTFAELAERVNKKWEVKSKHGLKVSKQLVHKILRNPIHHGWVEIPKFGISVQGKHEPIVSIELFNEVHELMRRGKNHKQPRNRNNPDFPLRGVECGHCGGNLSGGFTSGRSKKYAYYGCINPLCSERESIHKEDLENDFTEFLEKYTPDPSLMEALGEAIKVVSEKQSAENLSQTNRSEKTRAKLQHELEELLQLRVTGIIDNKTFIDEGEKRREKIRNLEAEEFGIAKSSATPDYSTSFGLKLLSEFPLTWSMLEPGELKALRAVLFPKNIQYQYPGFKTAELSPIYKVKAASGNDVNRLVTLRGIEPRFHP